MFSNRVWVNKSGNNGSTDFCKSGLAVKCSLGGSGKGRQEKMCANNKVLSSTKNKPFAICLFLSFLLAHGFFHYKLTCVIFLNKGAHQRVCSIHRGRQHLHTAVYIKSVLRRGQRDLNLHFF